MRFYSTFHIPCMKAARVRNIQGKITVYYRVKKGFCSTFHIPRIKAARVCNIQGKITVYYRVKRDFAPHFILHV